jgi:5'-methylthioadenosine phosphorylase
MSDPSHPPVIGIVGGSGIYDILGLDDVRWEDVASPFGTAPTSTR